MLRMAGFDTLYQPDFEDSTIADLSSREQRIVLTRDRDLLKRRIVAHGCYIVALKGGAQLRELFDRLDLQRHARPFTLCLHCNTPLRAVSPEAEAARLPPAVRTRHVEFQTCNECNGVFLEGFALDERARRAGSSRARPRPPRKTGGRPHWG